MVRAMQMFTFDSLSVSCRYRHMVTCNNGVNFRSWNPCPFLWNAALPATTGVPNCVRNFTKNSTSSSGSPTSLPVPLLGSKPDRLTVVGYAGVTSLTEGPQYRHLIFETPDLVTGSGSGNLWNLIACPFPRNAGLTATAHAPQVCPWFHQKYSFTTRIPRVYPRAITNF